MSSISESARFFHRSLARLYRYGLHVQLTALMAAFLETVILWTKAPKALLLISIICHLLLSSFFIGFLLHARRKSPIKINKTYRPLLFISLLQGLWWGVSSLLITDGTVATCTIHVLFLYGIAILYTLYLAPLPATAYSFLVISLTPMLVTFFLKAPAGMIPLAHSLLALTTLLGVGIFFYARTIRAAIHPQKHNSYPRSRPKTRLEKEANPDTSPPFSDSETIWDTILSITDQAHLQNSWQNCFSGKLSSLLVPLKIDRVYIVEANKNATPSPEQKNNFNFPIPIDHGWILNNPDCLALLKAGNIVHNQFPQISEQEHLGLEILGIQAFLDIPILLKGELWGIIGMDRLTHSTPFTPQQIKGLAFIANILAMTIRNQEDRKERDHLVSAVEQSGDCTLIVDPSGKIIYANPACETITGYSQSEIISANIQQLHPDTIMYGDTWKQILDALKNGEKWQGQFTNYRKDHSFYEEEMLLSPVYNNEGRITSHVIVKRNITEKKRLESIAEAANLMENIGFIFSSIRHELGNPINSIKVSLSVLDSNLEHYDKNDIKRFVTRSLTDIGRVEYLLNTLKNFSIFERPSIVKTDLTVLLTTFISLITKDLEKKNIRLTASIPSEPLFGRIDPRAFQQVLLNLVTNAADSLADTVDKSISLTLIREKEGSIEIVIGDNGCGISAQDQGNLFKPFFTTKIQGTGLGLVIVKKMLSKMNCSIDIHSKINRGTSVLIIIPAH